MNYFHFFVIKVFFLLFLFWFCRIWWFSRWRFWCRLFCIFTFWRVSFGWSTKFSCCRSFFVIMILFFWCLLLFCSLRFLLIWWWWLFAGLFLWTYLQVFILWLGTLFLFNFLFDWGVIILSLLVFSFLLDFNLFFNHFFTLTVLLWINFRILVIFWGSFILIFIFFIWRFNRFFIDSVKLYCLDLIIYFLSFKLTLLSWSKLQLISYISLIIIYISASSTFCGFLSEFFFLTAQVHSFEFKA